MLLLADELTFKCMNGLKEEKSFFKSTTQYIAQCRNNVIYQKGIAGTKMITSDYPSSDELP